ncbi:15243_t:CDS:2 [Entrophospora sp. SA101]|nr:15243_t:CDS:2 [Entrophospora sp. SA101]
MTIKELEKEVAILKRKSRLKDIENTYKDNVCKDLTLPNQTQLSIDTDNKRWRRILRDATILSCDEFWFEKPKNITVPDNLFMIKKHFDGELRLQDYFEEQLSILNPQMKFVKFERTKNNHYLRGDKKLDAIENLILHDDYGAHPGLELLISVISSPQGFTNVKAAIKRDSVISAVGEVGNRQNNLVILCECIEWIIIKSSSETRMMLAEKQLPKKDAASNHVSTNTKSVLSTGSSVSRLENISNSVIWDLQSITPKLKRKADIQTKYAKQLSKEGIDTFCQLLLHATISCGWSFNWVEDQKLLMEEVWFGVATIFQLKDKEKLGAMNTLKLG